LFDFHYLNRAQLADFIDSEAYKTLPVLPISRHRACAHIRNPRAQADDILLVLAYQKGELVGYLGLFADYSYPKADEIYRFAWLSTLWLHDAMRGKGLGGEIVQRGIAAWQGRCQVTEFVPAIKRMYDKTAAFNPQTIDIHGIRLYIRVNSAHILPPKKPIFKTLKPLLKVADACANLVLNTRFLGVTASVAAKKTSVAANIEYVNEIDTETDIFIQSLQQNQLYKRTATELNWILQNPWILTAPDSDSTSSRYLFSALADDFGYYALKIRNAEGELTAFLLFSKRDKILKLPFFYYKNMDLDRIIAIIDSHILKWKIDMFTVFHPALVGFYTKNRTLALYKKTVTRNFLIARDRYAALAAHTYDLQDGDADCAFT
jgi:GNAT superfamily N-acetyltransferase